MDFFDYRKKRQGKKIGYAIALFSFPGTGCVSAVCLSVEKGALQREGSTTSLQCLLQTLTAHWVSYVLGRKQCPDLSDIVITDSDV